MKFLRMAATSLATPRHMNPLLPLLPSGPGGVRNVSLRGDQRDHHRLRSSIRNLSTALSYPLKLKLRRARLSKVSASEAL